MATLLKGYYEIQIANTGYTADIELRDLWECMAIERDYIDLEDMTASEMLEYIEDCINRIKSENEDATITINVF